ncbi:MAG: class I SAM-dependent methyltransferase [Bacteroidia bacterium]
MSVNCKICGNESKEIFNSSILGKYNVCYYQCSTCYFTQTENPYWLGEAYNSALNIEDTGTMVRNLKFSTILTTFLFIIFNKKARFVDWGGGYGIFTRLMRDIGFDFYWSDKYAQNLVARGFEYNNKMGKVDAVTAFEVFEHLENPVEELKSMLQITDTIIFSTEPILYPAPNKNNWWYYAFEHGQHIAFYHTQTFKYLAKKFNLNYYSNGLNLHILSSKKLNPTIVKLILRLSKYTYPIFKLFLKSKTNTDNVLLKRK